MLGAINAFGAINAALFDRERTGRGHRIDVALFECIFHLLPFEMQEAQFPLEKFAIPIYQPLKTRDGFVIIMPISQRNFESLVQAIGHPEWLDDPRFASISDRFRNYDKLSDLMEGWTAQRTSAECEQIATSAGCPAARHQTITEAMKSSFATARGAVSEVKDNAGTFMIANSPFRIDQEEANAGAEVAAIGAHNLQVADDLLDLSREEFGSLLADGVFAAAD